MTIKHLIMLSCVAVCSAAQISASATQDFMRRFGPNSTQYNTPVYFNSSHLRSVNTRSTAPVRYRRHHNNVASVVAKPSSNHSASKPVYRATTRTVAQNTPAQHVAKQSGSKGDQEAAHLKKQLADLQQLVSKMKKDFVS